MKKLFLLLLLVTFTVQSQLAVDDYALVEALDYTVILKDSADDKEYAVTRDVYSLNRSLLYSMYGTEDEVAFTLLVNSVDEHCMDESTKIQMIFKDGSHVDLINYWPVNCAGTVQGIVKYEDDVFIDITEKELDSIIIIAADSYFVVEINEVKSRRFTDTFKEASSVVRTEGIITGFVDQ